MGCSIKLKLETFQIIIFLNSSHPYFFTDANTKGQRGSNTKLVSGRAGTGMQNSIKAINSTNSNALKR